jgi:hypothetical protein
MPPAFSRRHGVTPLPGEGVLDMLSGLAAGLAGRGLPEAEELVARADELARAGKVAQAIELLRQAAEGLPSD